MAVKEFPMTNWRKSMLEVIRIPYDTLIGSATTERYVTRFRGPTEKIHLTVKQNPDHWHLLD